MSIGTQSAGTDQTHERQPTQPGGGAALTPPPKRRRSPILIAAGVAAITVGALIAVWAYTATSNTEAVVAVRNTVERGATIEASDLMIVQVGADPALNPIPESKADSLVGQRAALDLSAGGLVTAEAITADVVPVSGQSVVGVSLTPAQMPAMSLQTGDAVRVVATPGDQGDVGSSDPASIGATVVSVGKPGVDGQIVVDVDVPESAAGELAARAATGKVALVLDSRER